jgi:HEPN domain-containing protein
MSDHEHAQMMLDLAQKDLKAVKGMMDEEQFEDEIFGFHAQQTVEKVVKAWLSHIGVNYPKTHDLEELFTLLEDQNQTIPENYRSLTDFTDFAVQFRYESFDDLSSDIDRANVIDHVEGLVDYISRLILS